MDELQYLNVETACFRPVSIRHFGDYARHLSRLTGDSYNRSRETLAKIYGYENANAVHRDLEQDGIPGPFHDEIATTVVDITAFRHAIIFRNIRAMSVILDANRERYSNGAPRPTMAQLATLQLFSSMKVHNEGFNLLALPETTSRERRKERQQYLSNFEDDYSDKEYPEDSVFALGPASLEIERRERVGKHSSEIESNQTLGRKIGNVLVQVKRRRLFQRDSINSDAK